MADDQSVKADNLLVTVEFTGLAQSLAGEAEIQLILPLGTTFAEIITLLAERYPDMVGVLIHTNKHALLSSNLFFLNNEMEEPAFFMDQVPQSGDRLTLVSVATGG